MREQLHAGMWGMLTTRRYNCYWMGQTCWTEVIRNSRAQSRLIWYVVARVLFHRETELGYCRIHVPLRLSPKTPEETEKAQTIRPEEELLQVMNEKRMALDLIEACVQPILSCASWTYHITQLLEGPQASHPRRARYLL